MRLETIPIILGVLVGVVGVLLVADAWMPDEHVFFRRDRRRRPRAERHRGGEALIGLGTLGMAVALVGGDEWGWGRLTVIVSTVLLVLGLLLNARYLKERLTFRGAARRMPPGETPPGVPEERRTTKRMRIR